MKRIFTILTFLLLIVVALQAQNENNNWLFGKKVGLTWNTTQSFAGTGMWGTSNALLSEIPTNIPSSIFTSEGCFSISDASGNLLFYSDGMTIWNKNNVPMLNGTGLTGHSSSAQSGIIIPYPNHPNLYIAFTLGYGNDDNLSYSVIDKTLDNGLGGVVSNKKNIRLTGYTGVLGESLTAIRHSNREDFWIVAAGRSTPAYLNVWKVDGNGVSQTPHQKISTGLNIPSTTSPGGYIASSNDGDKFVWCNYNGVVVDASAYTVFVFGTFDNTTGTITKLKSCSTGNNYEFGCPYGAAFNKKGDYLYVTSLAGNTGSTGASKLYVYNFKSLMDATGTNPLKSVSPVKAIVASPGGIPNNGINEHFGALGLAPNGYMYIVHTFSRNLYVITNPDDPANMKIYKLSNLIANGSTTVFGIPTAAAPWFRFQIVPPPEAVSCYSVSTSYELRVYGGEGFKDLKYITLDFGDGKPDSKIKIQSPPVGSTFRNHTYDAIGEYTITIKAYDQYDKEMQGMERKSEIKVRSCALPVNPHIH